MKMPSLPYAFDSLTPMLSKYTVETHYGKHTKAYYDTVSKLIKNTSLEDLSLEDILRHAHKKDPASILFNNAAQAWNHTFFWAGLATPSSHHPLTETNQLITSTYKTPNAFKKAFIEKANTHFASGWCWVVIKNNKLDVMLTDNAATPITDNITPIWVVDLWEHAYLYDPQYAANRKQYISNMWDLINWKVLEQRVIAHQSKEAE